MAEPTEQERLALLEMWATAKADLEKERAKEPAPPIRYPIGFGGACPCCGYCPHCGRGGYVMPRFFYHQNS